MCDLRQLVRDLIQLQVGMEVRDGQPTLTVPDAAEAMVRSNLETIRGNRDEVIRLWAEVAAEQPVWVCKACKALVLDPEAGATSRWAFCEFLFCPYRKDSPAVRFRRSGYEKRRLEDQRRARAIALGEWEPEPIPE